MNLINADSRESSYFEKIRRVFFPVEVEPAPENTPVGLYNLEFLVREDGARLHDVKILQGAGS